eukprot:1294490-Amphidinium_carterae.1
MRTCQVVLSALGRFLLPLDVLLLEAKQVLGVFVGPATGAIPFVCVPSSKVICSQLVKQPLSLLCMSCCTGRL